MDVEGCASTDTAEGDESRGAIETGVVARQSLPPSLDSPSDCARPRPVFAPALAAVLVLMLIGRGPGGGLWNITDDRGIGMGATIVLFVDC